ncbi:MAG: hypothetical protein GF333_04250 [Candidatus Omnitrophica bacterium]|nr:hypothetical protein [Candidatus Omnitrophota bacterium]
MANERLSNLIGEYRRVIHILRTIRGDLLRMETALEVAKGLKRELNGELERAQRSGKQERVAFWKEVIEEYFCRDEGFPTEQELKSAREAVEAKYKEEMYYNRKLKVIGKLLGSREVELLENYDRKNLYMGNDQSSRRHAHAVDEEEEEKAFQEEKERKKRVAFDKM